MTFVDKTSERYVISGTSGKIINEASKRLNFSYTVQRSADGLWGLPLPNGSWSGMIGMFVRNESDLSPGPFSVTPEREKVFDYSRQIIREYASILYVIDRKARTENKLDYLLTVDASVWFLLILNTIVICLLISYPYKFKVIFSNFFSSIEALLLGSFSANVTTNITLLYLFILMTSALRTNINALYGVSLVLFNNNEDINSIEDLANSQTFIPVIRNQSSFEFFFRFSDTEVKKKIWSRMIANKEKSFVMNENAIQSDNLIEKIINAKSAYMDVLMGLRTLSSAICNRVSNNVDVRVAKLYFRDIMISFAFRKKFDPRFQHEFDRLLLKLQESGIYENWWQKELRDTNVKRLGLKTQNFDCVANAWKTSGKLYSVSNSYDIALKVCEIKFAFYMIATGFLLSIIIYLTEIIGKKLFYKPISQFDKLFVSDWFES